MFRTSRPALCWFLSAVMTFSPALAYAQQPGAPGAAPAKPAKLDLTYVTPEAFVAVVARPRQVLTSPNMAMMPIEILSATGIKEVGIDPVDVEQIMVIAEPPAFGPPGAGVVVRFTKPHDLDSILPQLRELTEDGQIDGQPYRRGLGPMGVSLYMPDDRTLIVATEGVLQKMVQKRDAPPSSPLIDMLGKADPASDLIAKLSIDPIRPLVMMQVAGLPPVPPQFGDVKKIPELISSIEIQMNISREGQSQLVIRAVSEDAAKELENFANNAISVARQMMVAQIALERPADDPVQQATAKYTQRIMDQMFSVIQPVRDGDRLMLASSGEQQSQIAIIGILVALLLPAVQAAREAARRMQSQNNMKQLGLSLHNYHDANGHLPARASLDKEGKPLLSWRVHILPYLEEGELYLQFKLDEPWDSEHNKKLIDRMPETYVNPNGMLEPGKTNYLAPVGEGTIFAGTEALKFRQITDGMSNTIMLVEANADRAVVWTKPEDLKIDPKKPLAGLGGIRTGVFIALFADVSVRAISNDIDVVVLRYLFNASDGKLEGEMIDLD